MNRFYVRLSSILLLALCALGNHALAQNTLIKGFADVGFKLRQDKASFGLGEQDIFITSHLNEDFSFLGETVFRYNPEGGTEFEASIERIVISYNYYGNHNARFGKHHTPTHYWNDVYHHGRVFFPTIDRPLMFTAHTFPLHTTGILMNGLNLGKLKFGYNFMVGNGIGSTEFTDNDKYKSVTAAIHIKPKESLRIGVSFYHDVISAGAGDHLVAPEQIRQKLYTATIANFGKKFEFLAEGTITQNDAESTGTVNSVAAYAYTGWRMSEKIIPYIRYDYLHYDQNEIYYAKNNSSSILVGLRYEISYLIVVKMEYQYLDSENTGISKILSTQIAIGF
jgi:opacity protein-like surface antigen